MTLQTRPLLILLIIGLTGFRILVIILALGAAITVRPILLEALILLLINLALPLIIPRTLVTPGVVVGGGVITLLRWSTGTTLLLTVIAKTGLPLITTPPLRRAYLKVINTVVTVKMKFTS